MEPEPLVSRLGEQEASTSHQPRNRLRNALNRPTEKSLACLPGGIVAHCFEAVEPTDEVSSSESTYFASRLAKLPKL